MAVTWERVPYAYELCGTYVKPGTNTLSAAVAAMADGDRLLLAPGVYTQSEAVTIPTSVTKFSILGSGIGASKIVVTADVSGITSQTGSDAYRIERATIGGFTMLYDYSAHSTTASGIHIFGDWTNDTLDPRIIVSDVNLAYGTNGKFFKVGIYLRNSFNPVISNALIRPSANYASGTPAVDGIWLGSCMNGHISKVRVIGAENAIYCVKISDSFIKDSATKHGTEGTSFSQVMVDYSKYGALLGAKSYVLHFSACEFAQCVNSGIFETGHASDGGVGGYHSINGCDFDTMSTATGSHHIYLERPGTRIIGCAVKEHASANNNGICLAADAGNCTVSGNVIRAISAGDQQLLVYSDDNAITGNVFEGTTGNAMNFQSGADNNLIVGNRYRYASTSGDRISDSGTGNYFAGNKETA